MKDEWLKDLRDRMSDFGMDAPEGLWAEIEKSVVAEQQKSRGMALLRTRRISAAVAAALLVLCLLNFFGFFVNKPKFTNETPLIAGVLRDTSVIADDSPEGLVHGAVDARTLSRIRLFEPKDTAPAVAEDLHPAVVVCDSVLPATSEPVSDKCDTDSVLPFKIEYVDQINNHDVLLASAGHDDDRISVSIFYSAGFNSGVSQKTAGESMAAVGPDNSRWADSPVLGMLLFNKGKEITTDIRHRQPLRVGVSFSYRVSDRIALGTGLTYTGLVSDLKSGSSAHYCIGEQRLHYLGIPVNISYNFLTWNRLHLYAAAGFLAEKCVSGNVGYVYVIDGNTTENDSEGVGSKPVQFSLNATAGIQFDISNSVAIYAEPGFAYYFKDGSSLQTIYKDKPLNLDFNIGFRFTIGK